MALSYTKTDGRSMAPSLSLDDVSTRGIIAYGFVKETDRQPFCNPRTAAAERNALPCRAVATETVTTACGGWNR
jgi:hypothetical protein